MDEKETHLENIQLQNWPNFIGGNEVFRHVAKIHEFKGRLTAFPDHNPEKTFRHVEITKIQSRSSR